MIDLERSSFFYEIPIKRSMTWCNKYFKKGDNNGLLLAMGRVINYLPYEGWFYMMDFIDALKEADFFNRWDKAPELYFELKEKMNYIGFPWIEEDSCSLSLEGLTVWSE